MKSLFQSISIFSLIFLFSSCQSKLTESIDQVAQWTTYEIRLSSNKKYDNAYTAISLSANFTNEKGENLIRPGFWNGADEWIIRFSSPDAAKLTKLKL